MIPEKSIFSPANEPLSVGIVVLPESNTLSLAATVDPLRAANRRAGKPLFNWSFQGASDEDITLTSGVRVPAQPLARLEKCDLLVVIAGFRIDRHLTPALLAGLRRHHALGATIAGVDGGGWALARAGLLDGAIATTHWEDLDDMAREFERIHVVRNRYVISNRLVTSSGAAPTLDLMLNLIEARHGPRLAERVAGTFLYDPVHDSDQPQTRTRHARLPAKLSRAIALMDSRLEDPPTIPEIAATCGVSARQLELLFQQWLRTTPKAYQLSLRLAEAHRLAVDTTLSVQEIAVATGYASQAVFARAFRAAHGHSVRQLRQHRTRLGRPASGSLPLMGKNRLGVR